VKLGDTLGGQDADRLKKKLDKEAAKAAESERQRKEQKLRREGRIIRYNKEND
jgi:hypothetical protein